ncbi:hypothetical protein Ocin01_03484 [Orchesella cincta]|uniref:Uncharacterized protein n=1 Tax=Orchesella cincta TaxID=48709 RepID=A0A1D2NE12_ORCCI|nr:hypothetical protein Ocin01_03484 [Orchesella cincta]
MKSLPFLCLAVFLVISLQESYQAPPEKNCRQIAAEFTKRQIQGITSCTKSLKFKNGKDKSKKMNCILRCVMIKENLLAADGQVTADIYNKFIEQEFPSSLQDRFNGTFWNCMQIAFRGFKTLEEDEYCGTYDPFIKCMMGNVPGLCNWT